MNAETSGVNQPGDQPTALTPVEHLEMSSAAVSLYQATGILTHQESVETVLTYVTPVGPPESHASVVRDFYANYLPLATKKYSKSGRLVHVEEPLEASKIIYVRLNKVASVLGKVVTKIDRKEISEQDYKAAVTILDFITKKILEKSILL